jgi:hypothetical protein
MSTKSTIYYGDDFHFYNEVADDYNVYLQIDKESLNEFHIDENKLQICIPSAIWKIISEHKIEELVWAGKTDNHIKDYVIKEVDLRINDFKNSSNKKGLSDFLYGSFTYGYPDELRDIQIKNGINYFSLKREQENKILDKYLEYKKTNLK